MLKDYFEVPNKPAIKSGNILSCDFTDHETFIPQPLDYTRGTLATYVDCNGLIKMSGVSDTELVANGDFATDSDWTKEAGWTISEGAANFSGGTGNRAMYQAVGITNGKTYKIQYEVSSISAGQVAVRFGGMPGVDEITATTIGIYTGYITATGSANGNIHIEDNNNNFVGSIDNVSVKEVDVETPRIDYTTEIGKAKELQKPSLLLEPQSINLFQYSENFSQGYWVKSSCTVQKSTITSPDGLQSSYKLIPDAGTGGNRSIGRNFSSLTNFHTFSVFAKAGEYKYAILRTRNPLSVVVSFDLENGTFNVNQSGAVYVADSAKIENYGNGWYKCSVTLDPSQANDVGKLYPSVSVGITGNEINDFDGDGISGIYIFGAQFEEQSYSTSYIPTSGGIRTRNQDLANNAGQLGVFNDEEGTLYAEINIPENIADNVNIAISDGTNTEYVKFIYLASTSTFRGEIKSSGNTVAVNYTSLVLGSYSKVAVSYKSGEFKLYVNGSQIGSTLTGHTLPTGLDTFSFDRGDAAAFFYGKVKEVKVFRRALTDTELTELTNNIV